MAVYQQALRYGQRRALNRFSRSVPWIGAAIALLTVASTMRRKGVMRGALDTILNAIPFVGLAKNTAEVFRGRDFIADRRLAASVDPRARLHVAGQDGPGHPESAGGRR
jgi:hypothetical protein